MPDTDYPAFVRRATFTNTDESESVSLEVLDGIAQIEPYGVDDWTLKMQVGPERRRALCCLVCFSVPHELSPRPAAECRAFSGPPETCQGNSAM